MSVAPALLRSVSGISGDLKSRHRPARAEPRALPERRHAGAGR